MFLLIINSKTHEFGWFLWEFIKNFQKKVNRSSSQNTVFLFSIKNKKLCSFVILIKSFIFHEKVYFFYFFFKKWSFWRKSEAHVDFNFSNQANSWILKNFDGVNLSPIGSISLWLSTIEKNNIIIGYLPLTIHN